jgi:nucleolar protein 9
MAEKEEDREQLLGYFARVETLLNELDAGAGAPPEAALVVANVFAELRGKEARLAQDLACSRVLERLVAVASPAQLRALFAALHPHREALAANRFGSHVLQAMLARLAAVLVGRVPEAAEGGAGGAGGEAAAEQAPEPDAFDEAVVKAAAEIEVPDTLLAHLLQMCSLLQGELAFYLADNFASHVLRTLVRVLAGLPAPAAQGQGRSRKSATYRDTVIPLKTSKTAASEEEAVSAAPRPPVFARLLDSLGASIQSLVGERFFFVNFFISPAFPHSISVPRSYSRCWKPTWFTQQLAR